jgi:hypothetical protein
MNLRRILHSIKVVVLFSAATHLTLLAVYAVMTQSILPLNYFNIIDLDLFFPEIIEGTMSQILSFVLTALLLIGAYLFFTKKEPS